MPVTCMHTVSSYTVRHNDSSINHRDSRDYLELKSCVCFHIKYYIDILVYGIISDTVISALRTTLLQLLLLLHPIAV